MMSAGLRGPNGRVRVNHPQPGGSHPFNAVKQAPAPTVNGHLNRKRAKPTADGSERLLLARDEILDMEQEIRFKESAIACSKKLLKQKESLVRKLQHDLVKAESERDMQIGARKEVEANNASLKQQIWDTHETFARLEERLRIQCNMKSDARRLNKLAWDNIELYSSNMAAHAQTVEKVFQALSSQKETLKEKNRELTAELQSCKKELSEKSQQYETAVSQGQAWEKRHRKLEKSMEQLNDKVVMYRAKNDDLLKNNSGLHAELMGRSSELAKEQEKFVKLLLEVCELHGVVWDPDDSKDPSKAMEAVEAAFNKLSVDCNTLREKEAETAKRVEDLEADKSLLETDNLQLSEKLQFIEADCIHLQEAKQKLEAEVEWERKKAGNRMCTIRMDIEKFRDECGKFLQDRRRFEDVLSSMQTLKQNVVRQKEQLCGAMRRLQKVDSWMRRQQAERLRLSAECTDKQTTIACLEREVKELCEGITNFELLAESKAEELVRAEEKIQSLADDLAATCKEIMPVEEREKIALLLLEKDSLIAQLDTKLKDTEEGAVKLERELSAASDAAKSLREANEGLKSALASLAAERELERERQENKVDSDSQTEHTLKHDCDTQTEAATKADCDMQTEGTLKVDCNMQTEHAVVASSGIQTEGSAKVDSVVQTQDAAQKVDAELQTEGVAKVDCATITEETGGIASKLLASTQLQVERLSSTIEQHNLEKRVLRNNLTEYDRNLTQARNTCSTLQEQVMGLKKQLEDSNKENNEMKEGIRSLELRLASQEKQAQEASLQQVQADGQTSAALTAENKKLVAEVSALKGEVKQLHERFCYAAETYHMKTSIIERLLSTKQEELDFLKNEVARLTRIAGGGPLPLHRVFASFQQKPAQTAAEKPASTTSTPVTKPGDTASKGQVVASPQRKPAQVGAKRPAVVVLTPVTKPGKSATKSQVSASAQQKPAQAVAQKPTVVVLTPVSKSGELAAQGQVSASALRKLAQVVAEKTAVVASTPLTKSGETLSEGQVLILTQPKPTQVVAEKPANVASTPVTEPGELASKGPSTPGLAPTLLELLTSKHSAPPSTASAAHAPKGNSLTDKSDQALGLPKSRGSRLSLSSRETTKAGHDGPTDEATTSALKRSFVEQEKMGHPTLRKASLLPPLAPSVAPQPVAKKRRFFKSSSGRD